MGENKISDKKRPIEEVSDNDKEVKEAKLLKSTDSHAKNNVQEISNNETQTDEEAKSESTTKSEDKLIENDKSVENSQKIEEIETNIKENNNQDKKTPAKFVFGSTTGFGNMGGFSMFGSGKNVFSSKSEDNANKSDETNTKTKDENKVEPLKIKETSSKSIFGSGSTYGNAFQEAINKKNVFDDMKKDDTDSGTDNTSSTEVADVYKKVHLEKQDVKSGEEEETTLFQVKAKLYHMELSKLKDGWKERGFGIIKVNKLNNNTPDKYISRLVMRQNGNLKLILNMPIVKGLTIIKGIPSSLSADKFIRIQVVEDGEPIQYAIKVGQVENSSKLFETIEQQIPK